MERSTDVVCPIVQERLELEKDKSSLCKATPSTPTLFQQPEEFVSDYYKRDAYLKNYNLGIPPVPGQKYWPKRNSPLNPPPIKVGPGRPRKKRRRDPHEGGKKKGRLTKHGLEMTCSICKLNTHNKRKCPDKDKPLPPPPTAKKSPGRPRKHRRVEEGSLPPSQQHHDVTAEPSRIGKSGRVTRTGRGGAKGKGRGKVGRATQPQGFGVLYDDSGNVMQWSGATTMSLAKNIGPSTQTSSNFG